MLQRMNELAVKAANGTNSAGDRGMIQQEVESLLTEIEVKYVEESQMERVCQKALRQIEDKHYTQELEQTGIHTIMKYGIACNKKGCKVILEIEHG